MKKIAFHILSFLLVFIFTFSLIELVFRVFIFKMNPDLQKIYEAVTNPSSRIPYSAQPFLNYINTPHLQDKYGNIEVNSMGIRYPREVEIVKPDSTLRILFLGGSTTFGEVDEDYDAFPAMIEDILRNSFAQRHPKYRHIECLNAGAHGLTSAEILNHYQFKYQYLQPDILVLHTGLNDAFAYAQIGGSLYQPDYHNTRRVFYDVDIPQDYERILLHSKAYTYFLIHSRLKDFMNNSLEKNIFFFHSNDKLWFKPGNAAVSDTNYNAFYNNIKTLSAIANSRKVSILIVPEVIDTTKMPGDIGQKLFAGLLLNKQMLAALASNNKNIYLRNLPERYFTPDCFEDTDGIHTNETGDKIKAQYITNYLQDLITSKELEFMKAPH